MRLLAASRQLFAECDVSIVSRFVKRAIGVSIDLTCNAVWPSALLFMLRYNAGALGEEYKTSVEPDVYYSINYVIIALAVLTRSISLYYGVNAEFITSYLYTYMDTGISIFGAVTRGIFVASSADKTDEILSDHANLIYFLLASIPLFSFLRIYIQGPDMHFSYNMVNRFVENNTTLRFDRNASFWNRTIYKLLEGDLHQCGHIGVGTIARYFNERTLLTDCQRRFLVVKRCFRLVMASLRSAGWLTILHYLLEFVIPELENNKLSNLIFILSGAGVGFLLSALSECSKTHRFRGLHRGMYFTYFLVMSFLLLQRLYDAPEAMETDLYSSENRPSANNPEGYSRPEEAIILNVLGAVVMSIYTTRNIMRTSRLIEDAFIRDIHHAQSPRNTQRRLSVWESVEIKNGEGGSYGNAKVHPMLELKEQAINVKSTIVIHEEKDGITSVEITNNVEFKRANHVDPISKSSAKSALPPFALMPNLFVNQTGVKSKEEYSGQYGELSSGLTNKPG